jgi:hypothetical protein
MSPSERPRLAHYEKQLRLAYQESPWHSFKLVLQGVKAEEALWKPPHYKGFPWMSGNILDIVFHLGGDTRFQLSYALGDRSVTWEKLTEEFQARGGDLAAALTMADESFSELQQALNWLTDAHLARRYETPDGQQAKTLEEFIQMLLEHYFYHAGQIRYIRCLWEGQRKSLSR